MAEIWFIGDTHFGHRNLVKGTSRWSITDHCRDFHSLEEHDEAVVSMWNDLVNKDDVVYHLGDVAFNKQGVELVQRLNGKKILVLGNHDNYSVELYAKYFHKIAGMLEFKRKTILTHAPMHFGEGFYSERYSVNIHGHVHNKGVKHLSNRHFNVNLDAGGFKLTNWDEIINFMNTGN